MNMKEGILRLSNAPHQHPVPYCYTEITAASVLEGGVVI